MTRERVHRPMTPADDPDLEIRYERFTVTYPSGTALTSFYCGGITLAEVRVTHPLAVVEAIEDSLVDPR